MNIKKLLRNEDWKSWLEDTVGVTLAEFIETALNEWLALEITVGHKKNRKTIEVAGVDSYTHRTRK
jgi:hypothetical protein